MAHHIYHTRGIILGSSPSGEANRFYKIFTEELGLVGATAQSVRAGKSKLRYTLQDYATIFVDLVRGKEVWRITSAIEEQPIGAFDDLEQKKLFIHVCAIISRLLQGEGRERKLFLDVRTLADFLKTTPIPSALLLSIEALASLRALSALGYVDARGYSKFLKPGEYSLTLLGEFEVVRGDVAKLVSAAFVASHL